MRDKLIARVLKRGDEWGEVVLAQAKSVTDFVAAEVMYHNKCFSRYFCDKTSDKTQGRPEEEEKPYAIDMLCAYLHEKD